ncbi:MAG TPA: hypothetical protein VF755_19260 [Catenuloplanes sp.]|jgi:hypothetical protein
MNDILDPPAERDLPAARSTRMRAHLLASMGRPPKSIHRRRLVLALAAVTAVAGLAVPVLTAHRDGNDVEALAMSVAELSPPLQDLTRECLRQNVDMRAEHGAESLAMGYPIPTIKAADLAMAARRGSEAVLVYLTPTGYYLCESGKDGPMGGGGQNWPTRDWLPGTVDLVQFSSTEAENGGDVIVAGRVSDRVDRLVLEHGNGTTTTARVERGVFGLLSNGRVEKHADLVSYGEDGREIDRFPLYKLPREREECFADPSGRVVYGKADRGRTCLPAEPWTR